LAKSRSILETVQDRPTVAMDHLQEVTLPDRSVSVPTTLSDLQSKRSIIPSDEYVRSCCWNKSAEIRHGHPRGRGVSVGVNHAPIPRLGPKKFLSLNRRHR